jgi:hypothetical protein
MNNMKMRCGISVALLAFLVVLVKIVYASVSPSTISEELTYQQTKVVALNITNDLNTSKTITIYSGDTTLVQVGASSLTLQPGESIKLNLFLIGSKVGQYTVNVYVGEETVPVSLTITPTSTPTTGDLEVSITKARMVVEQNIQSSTLLFFKNKYLEPVEIRDVYIEGSILTSEGYKPLGWSGKLKTLEPGEDLTLTILIDTRGIAAGTYPTSLTVIGFVGNNKITKKVDFEIVVTPSLKPAQSGTVTIEILPLEPIPDSLVSVTLKDSSGKIIDGTATVTVYKDDTKVDEFKYTLPFKVEADKKYCIKGEAPYYNSAEKCFNVYYKTLYIKVTPSNPTPNDTIMIQLVDEKGNLAPSGSIKINNDVYPGSEISLSLEKGNYTIIGEAQGFSKATKELYVGFQTQTTEQKPSFSIPFISSLPVDPIYLVAGIGIIVLVIILVKRREKKYSVVSLVPPRPPGEARGE